MFMCVWNDYDEEVGDFYSEGDIFSEVVFRNGE